MANLERQFFPEASHVVAQDKVLDVVLDQWLKTIRRPERDAPRQEQGLALQQRDSLKCVDGLVSARRRGMVRDIPAHDRGN